MKWPVRRLVFDLSVSRGQPPTSDHLLTYVGSILRVRARLAQAVKFVYKVYVVNMESIDKYVDICNDIHSSESLQRACGRLRGGVLELLGA